MRLTFFVTCCFLGMQLGHADDFFIDPANDANHFGDPEDPLSWTPEQKIAGFRNSDQLFWTRVVEAGDAPLELPEASRDLDDVVIRVNDDSMTVDDYFSSKKVAGLLVIKDGQIVYERYGLGNTKDSRWVSFSVTKSVVSMLIGAAIKDGYIENVDKMVTDYLPRMKGSSYEQASIKDILQMASGVEWDENYADPESDVASVDWHSLMLLDQLSNKPRIANPGEVFNYNTAETNLAGTMLRAAIGNNLSTYLSEKIWKPFGMAADATWNLTEEGGGEFGGCCISATLRDYGRLGLFALANGRLSDGTEVLPGSWMAESTTPSIGNKGYGYYWWLGQEGAYAASGIYGQGIRIDHKNNVVIAIQSARDEASNDADWAWQIALYYALTDAVTEEAMP
jgi:CubicO group peptidase (beta-lactamase class C family)